MATNYHSAQSYIHCAGAADTAVISCHVYIVHTRSFPHFRALEYSNSHNTQAQQHRLCVCRHTASSLHAQYWTKSTSNPQSATCIERVYISQALCARNSSILKCSPAFHGFFFNIIFLFDLKTTTFVDCVFLLWIIKSWQNEEAQLFGKSHNFLLQTKIACFLHLMFCWSALIDQ